MEFDGEKVDGVVGVEIDEVVVEDGEVRIRPGEFNPRLPALSLTLSSEITSVVVAAVDTEVEVEVGINSGDSLT